MIPFNVLFEEGSNQLEYKGKLINKYFEVDSPGEYDIKIRFVSRKSQYNQAVVLFFNDFIGSYYLFGEEQMIPKTRFPKKNYWSDTAPRELELKLLLKKGSVWICNGSDPLGTKQFCRTLHYGCAMYIEKIGENYYRFNCNDHENDDDFDDLVFEMEIVQKTSSICVK
ncbi:MAG: hypothetical protein J6I64_09380 [Lachnospiraceae bacterium]|nr:hypothetical protein [Lachnospiraceae bacterium]